MTLINKILAEIESKLGSASNMQFMDMVTASPSLKQAIKDEQESISQLETKANEELEYLNDYQTTKS